MRFLTAKLTPTRYILIVLQLLRKDARFFLAGTLVAVALRLVFVLHFPGIVDDSRLYADIAMNWLQYGVYGITNSGHVVPTLSRLPGYPAFLAAVFAVFGWSNFRAVLLIQILFDLGSCFLVADLARRVFNERAAKAAFMLAAACPFLANYSAAALTETLEIFFTVLALDLACMGLASFSQPTNSKSTAQWTGCGLSIAACILLRPDGGILLAAIAGFLVLLFLKAILGQKPETLRPLPILRAGIILLVSALAPLVPWTLRNLHTLHRFEPLAPRYANDNRDHDVSPELDARFAALASARIHSAPFRYYLWLSALRIADMWLRPRTELLPSDPRWWEFNDARGWLAISIIFGLVNFVYVVAALAGFLRGREAHGFGLLIFFLVIRSLFLGTLENPEPRYTLECYPVVIVAAAALFIGKSHRMHRNPA